MRNNCRALTNSNILWDGASIISPTSLTPKQNKWLNWERNLSFLGQHNNWEDTSNSFCKELQCSLLDDGFDTHNKRLASSHEVTKCWTHVEPEILSEIHPFSNCHHEALIVVLPCVPLFSMKYWTISHRSYLTSEDDNRIYLSIYLGSCSIH